MDKCPRCEDWNRMGLSATCPDCDRAANMAAIPTTPSHTESRDHTGIREVGAEYREGHDAQLAPHTPGPGGRRVLPGSAT